VSAPSTAPDVRPKVQLCSLVSEASGEDLIGSAWSTSRYIMIELPLPWAYETLGSRHVPPGLKDVIYGLYAKGISWGFLAMAPDPDYSIPGMTRILEHDLIEGATTGYRVREFLVPSEAVVSFMTRYANDPRASDVVAYQRSRDEDARDIFVCTHGAIDACCAKFGYPAYRELKNLAIASETNTRVWRCTHFGGHRFAATMLEMPSGRYWGRMKPRYFSGLISRDVPTSEMRACYRGWATLPHTLQQVAEGEAFVRGGWEWTRCAVTASPPPEDPEATSGRIQLAYVHPDGERGSITIDVMPDRVVQTMGSSSSNELLDAQQYRCEVVAVSPPGGLLDR
jgi:hypothetical protein